MYPILNATDMSRMKNDGLRTYSRLEYGTPDGTWLLVAAGVRPSRRKPSRRRLVAWLRQTAGRTAPVRGARAAEG